ncbi:MAG: hypothetical protein Q7K33_02845 [Candidatus Berkelbacteria bacterium]|nr:hypothetical protein [Candidatus Berkelbacteria bacterium]
MDEIDKQIPEGAERFVAPEIGDNSGIELAPEIEASNTGKVQDLEKNSENEQSQELQDLHSKKTLYDSEIEELEQQKRILTDAIDRTKEIAVKWGGSQNLSDNYIIEMPRDYGSLHMIKKDIDEKLRSINRQLSPKYIWRINVDRRIGQLERTPEDIERISNAAMERVQDITQFGICYHESMLLESQIKDIVENGFSSRSQLEIEGRTNYLRGINIFPEMISFSMKSDPEKPIKLEYGHAGNIEPRIQDYGLYYQVSLLLNSKFIDELVVKGEKPILFTGEYFKEQEGQARAVEYLKAKGWYERLQNCLPPIGKEEDTYDHRGIKNAKPWRFEILMYPEDQSTAVENPIGGLVMGRLYDELPELIIDASVKSLRNAIPIYDPRGNLLWPKRMNYKEVKKMVTERDEQQLAAEQPKDGEANSSTELEPEKELPKDDGTPDTNVPEEPKDAGDKKD